MGKLSKEEQWRRAGYETVEQVYDETDNVLSRKRDIGVAAMCEINHALDEWEER